MTINLPDYTTTQLAAQFRALIGPRFHKSDHACFWSWSGLTEGSVYDPASIPETTVTDALFPNATTLVVDSTENYPASGGLWVGPNGEDEDWEYVEYSGKTSTSFTGLVRDPLTDENTGVHSAGSVVKFWWQIEADAGSYTLTEIFSGNLSGIGIQGSMSGDLMPRRSLRNNHLVLIQNRFTDSSYTWGDWHNALVCWIIEPKVNDTYDRRASWDITLGGINEILGQLQVSPLRVGDLDLALMGNATASRQLGKQYKELHSGEFLNSNANLAPKSAVDDDPETVYMSEIMIGNDECIESGGYPDLGSAMAGFDQVHIAPYEGQGPGYRWVQMHVKPKKQTPFIANGFGNSPQFTGVVSVTAPRLIFVENIGRFSEENPYLNLDPLEPSTQLIEIAGVEISGGMTASEWWDSLAPSGGSVISPSSVCSWGAEGGARAPLPGETTRKLYLSGGSYVTSHVSTPGYSMHQWMTRQHYLLAELQGLGLTLGQDMTASYPGSSGSFVVRSGKTPCSSGLPSSGSLLLGTEYLSYTAKDHGIITVGSRGINGTVASAHKEGEIVYVFEDGIATDGWPVKTFSWQRKSGLPTLKQFYYFASPFLTRPRIVGDGLWPNDYDELLYVTGNTLSSHTHTITPKRYKWAMLLGERMTTDPYRFAVNQFKVIADPSVYDPHTHIDASTVFQVARELLLGVGIDDNLIVDLGDTPTISDFATSDDNCWTVLVDLMDRTGCYLTAERDGKISVGLHPFWKSTYSGATTHEWSRSNVSRIELDHVRGTKIGQIELEWELHDKSSYGTVRYPQIKDALGTVQKVGPFRYASEEAAGLAAQKLYTQARRPYSSTLQAATLPWATKPGLIHSITWDFAGEELPHRRSYILDRVDHRIEASGIEVVMHALQVSGAGEE